METMWILLFLFSLFGIGNGTVKRWLPNTNFGNPLNWEGGKIPCGNTVAVIPDDSPSVYLQMNTTIKELRLPSSDMSVVLDSDIVLGFTDELSQDTNCLSDGQEVNFNKTYPSDWFDPKNWCSQDTGTSNCSDVVIESEMVPCSYDDVVFPKNNLFYVNLESGVEIVVKTLTITGQTYSSGSFTSFLDTDLGKSMFPQPHNGDRSNIRISRRPCNNPLGCLCGNDKPEILDRICNLQTPFCEKVQCKNPITPTGSCCPICGSKLMAEYGTGFKIKTLKDGLQRNFLDGKDQAVLFGASRTWDNKIQMVVTDRQGGESSNQIASLMMKDIDQDIRSGGFKYSLRKIALEQSGPAVHTPSTGARTGGSSSSSGGKTAGIVIGLLVLIGGAGATFYFVYWKRRDTEVAKFKMFDRMSFRRKIRKPHLEVPPIFGFGSRTEPETVGATHQGFENPIYGNTSSMGMEKMDLELMPPSLESDEQPTFDLTGFDNPLYQTKQQESPFSDPTKVTQDEREASGLPSEKQDD